MRSRLLPFLTLLIAIFVFFGYTNPLYQGAVSDKRAAIVSDTEALAAAQTYQQKSSDLASAEASLDQQGLARVETLLPDSVGNVGLIVDLNALASKTGLAISSINVADSAASSAGTDTSGSGDQSTSPVASVDMSIEAKGTYSALQAFLRGIESSQRLLDVTKITIGGGDGGVYGYSITVRLYWLR
jgi:Tfp pilus assembly protein PilO